MYMAMEILKFVVAIVMTGRLLFDSYEWKNAMTGQTVRRTKIIRKRRRPGSAAPAA
jgi:hypothetical protein